ncbi:MAG: hypothetical protein MMC33_004615 [Icmadophila ericetorum]|nr:hypothetical protein [Icmadophila ericetorum]
MSLPPEKVILRRKRSAEPLERLYIQQDGHSSSTIIQKHVYKRIRSEAILSTQLKSWEDTSEAPRVPIVRSTLEEYANIEVSSTHRAVDLNGKTPEHAGGNSLFQGTPTMTLNDLRSPTPARASPRSFQLSRTLFSPSPSSSLHYGGVRKQKKARRTGHPVFVEKHPDVHYKPVSSQSELPTLSDADAVMEDNTSNIQQPPSPTRKRPNVSEAEKRLREKHKVDIAKKEQENRNNALSPGEEEELLKLAEELNEFTVEEMCISTKSASPTTRETPAQVPTGPANLRFQPKAPPPRRVPTPSANTLTDDAATFPTPEEMDTSPDHYVYDTYVRHTLPASPTTTDPAATFKFADSDAVLVSLPSKLSNPYRPTIPLDPTKDGVLVIPASDQGVWDTYFEDPAASDDEAEMSDDEDSNAEEWYGNDYPEDEFEEEDRLGVGAYDGDGYGEEWMEREEEKVFGEDEMGAFEEED